MSTDDFVAFTRLSRALLLSGRSGDVKAQEEQSDVEDWHRMYASLITKTLTLQAHLLSSPLALESVRFTVYDANIPI
jgi:hypothetical protein